MPKTILLVLGGKVTTFQNDPTTSHSSESIEGPYSSITLRQGDGTDLCFNMF